MSNRLPGDEPSCGSSNDRHTLTSSDDIFTNEHDGTDGETTGKVSCREYYSYKLQDRPNVSLTLLYALRLLQQFIVDMYIKVEAKRLDFFRTQQTRIRADLYQGIVDSVVSGETRGSHVGKRIVLPASFVGGPRDMRRKRYLDVIALVEKYGKPDFFITMTCNPDWGEIQACLKPGQTSQDRQDVVARIFRAKLHDLKQQLFMKKKTGHVAAHVYVVEFQKRGLPQAHMLIIMESGYKILDPDEFDRFVCAEIPDPIRYPDLHAKVLKHMIHGPYGKQNPKNSCMQNECRNYYPRQFAKETTQGRYSYPVYKRRNDGREVVVRNTLLDNRWVVPYNPYLLSRYDCHNNVEVCSGIKVMKYLYKYIYKGHDKVEVQIQHANGPLVIDEIQQYQNTRWVIAPEAIWRIYGFNLNEISPAVVNLQLHLPNKQIVSYWESQDLTKVLQSDLSSQTMLTEFFTYCLKDKDKLPYLYADFPESHIRQQVQRCWRKRKHKKVIGKLNSASPAEGERYFLRLLLNHVHSTTSFEDLLSNNGIHHKTFKGAAESR